MENLPENNDVVVVIFFHPLPPGTITCDRSYTLAEVKSIWLERIAASPCVAFFSSAEQFLADNLTVGQALQQIGGTSSVLELKARPALRCQIQLFGYESSIAPFEVAGSMTPRAMGQEIQRKVGIATDDYRISSDAGELRMDTPFNEQDLGQEAVIIVDLRIQVNVTVEQSEGDQRKTFSWFGSQTIGDLRQELELDESVVFVTVAPYRRVLDDALCLCHIVDDVLELHAPLELYTEKKTVLIFEPIDLPHRRQEVAVPLSSAPIEIKQLLTERFELTTDFRLSLDGAPLNDCQPLLDQITAVDTVIQLDLVRPAIVRDMWPDLREMHYDDDVYLYSTESPVGLFLRDFINDQKLIYDGIQLTIFGSVIDVFGAISGQQTPALLIDRDVERNLPVLSFPSIERKLAWARSLMLDIVPVSRGIHPKEVMCNRSLVAAKKSLKQICLSGDSLVTLDPIKVVVKSDKKLSIHRFARGSTHRDVIKRMQLLKGKRDLTLQTRYNQPVADEMISAQMDLSFYLLACSSRYETRLTVSLDGRGYGCWFEPDRVSFTDIMIAVGKQAKVPPRHLFSRNLYCCGCGRRVCKEEEEHQKVPSDCCRVKSLELTDRKLKTTGMQTAIPRRLDKETYTLHPEERDACVGTVSKHGRAITNASTELQSVATDPLPPASASSPPPPRSVRVVVTSPEGETEQKSLSVADSCFQTVLDASEHHFRSCVKEEMVAFCEERIFEADNQMGRAMRCFDRDVGQNHFFEFLTGRPMGIDDKNIARFIRFLGLESKLPPVPDVQPRVLMRTRTDFLTTDRHRGVKSAPDSALGDRAFVALLRGVRCGGRLFLEDDLGDFSDTETGQVFEQNRIPGGSGESEKRHFILFLKEDYLIPRFTPPNQGAFLLCARSGLELRMQEKNVCCERATGVGDNFRWRIVLEKNVCCERATGVGDNFRWRIVLEKETFYKKFKAAMRR